MNKSKLMINDNLTEDENALIKVNAANVLSRFYSKWRNSFENDKIYFDEAETELNRTYHHVLRTTGVNVNTLKTFSIIVSANLSSKIYTENFYYVSLYVDDDSINNFKTKNIDPIKLRNNFIKFYSSVTGSELNEREASGLTFLFDHNAVLLSIKITFTHYEDQAARRVDHCLYLINDINTLRKHKMVRSGFVNFCNFGFLWEHTPIEDIINATDFYAAYKIYVADIERYHMLLQMEKI